MNLADDIKTLALEIGFHAVGITSAEPFLESERALLDRFDCGLLEGSGFEPTRIRAHTHPRQSSPQARSIISVALSYLSDEPEPSGQLDQPRGWIARFARGLDYHQVIQERLFALAGRIQSRVGRHVEIRSFADTGPLVDRSAAIRAGLGSRGKNTCVYVGEYKSWVILGELLTDLELQPDDPAPLDVCGECTKCMDACPTGAICEPYTVDVRICLSQVTQMKGFVPHWLRDKLGTRIYGCDTCQEACPLNEDAKPGNVEGLRPSQGLGANPELLPFLNLTPDEFREIIHPTTAGWIRRTRFRRNIAIALGNIGDPRAVPALDEALADPEPVIRGHAAWALGKIGCRRQILEAALCRETDPLVEAEIRAALDAG